MLHPTFSHALKVTWRRVETFTFVVLQGPQWKRFDAPLCRKEVVGEYRNCDHLPLK